VSSSPPPILRRIGVAATGGGVVLLGVVLMPLPGPGTLIAMVGLSILGREFAWARRLLARIRSGSGRMSRWALRRIDRSGGRGR
jgi:uncharacterized protein (TIGR02611 family)